MLSLLVVALVSLFTASHGDASAFTTSNYNYLTRARFGTMETFVQTQYYVYHMEPDLFTPGNILFSDGSSLKTTDGSTTKSIVGLATSSGSTVAKGTSARFSSITGFKQISKTQVVVCDHNNYVLRLVDRLDLSTEILAGTSRGYGLDDGYDAKFKYPQSVVQDPRDPNKLIISDYGNNRIRSFDMKTKFTSTLPFSTVGYTSPNSLSFSPSKDGLIISTSNYVMMHSLSQSTQQKLFGSPTSGSDVVISPINDAKFNSPRDVIALSDSLFLVADKSNHVIRVVDHESRLVTRLCSGEAETRDGPSEVCALSSPAALMLQGDYLYVGDYKTIRRVKFSQLSSDACADHSSSGSNSGGIRRCPAGISLVTDVLTKRSTYTYRDGDEEYQLQLPAGTYPLSITSPSRQCQLNVQVFSSRQGLKKRLAIQAEYSVQCSKVNATMSLLQTIVTQRYSQIEEICGGKCKKSSNAGVTITCSNDIATITWPTDQEYSIDVQQPPSDVTTKITNELSDRKKILDILIYTEMPPIIYPKINSLGLPAKIVLTPFCTGGRSYNEASSSCV